MRLICYQNNNDEQSRIYAVCRIVDDSIDVHQDVEYLHKINRDVKAIEHQTTTTFESDDRIMTAFADAATHFQMNFQAPMT